MLSSTQEKESQQQEWYLSLWIIYCDVRVLQSANQIAGHPLYTKIKHDCNFHFSFIIDFKALGDMKYRIGVVLKLC